MTDQTGVQLVERNSGSKPTDDQEQQQEDQVPKETQILQQQREVENSDEEDILSDSAEVFDANDLSVSTNRANLDMNLSHGGQKIWLVKLPRFLAEKWRNKEELHGQDLGKIKIKKQNTNSNNRQPVIKLSLNNDETNKDIPHNYNLNLTKQVVENQYVFTEENLMKLDNTQSSTSGTGDQSTNGASSSSVSSKVTSTPNTNTSNATSANGIKKPNNRRKRRFNKWKNEDGTDKVIPFVKTIPKKTSLEGTIVHECLVTPIISDPNYSKIIEQRKRLIREEPRPSVTLLSANSGATFSNTGLTLKTDTSTFLKNATNNKNKNEGRAVRMPQKNLFDLLFKLFDEYDYWSLKGLKERTKQPEVYLKETLDQIANLIKKGPYALKYTLKREYKELKDQERAERLGELAKDDEDEEEDDNEDDVEMEDVV